MNTPKLHTVCVVGAPADVSARIHALLDEQRTRLDARWRIGVNVHNVLDHRPRYYGRSSLAYSPSFDDVVGRYVLLSVHYQR